MSGQELEGIPGPEQASETGQGDPTLAVRYAVLDEEVRGVLFSLTRPESRDEWIAIDAATQAIMDSVSELLGGPLAVRLDALRLAEDVLSRFPYSANLWPNGRHPNTGIEQIRAAIACDGVGRAPRPPVNASQVPGMQSKATEA